MYCPDNYDAHCKLKTIERMNEMGKDLLGNKIADTCVSIPKAEYETLLRESETLRILTDLVMKDTILANDTIKTILKTEREETENELI